MVRLLLLLLLAVAALQGVQGDFNAEAVKLAIARLRNSLEQPEMQSTILQDGFRSQFLFNDSRVQWNNVGSLLFAQIRSLQKFGTYYHLWTGFEDGAFLGYYDKGGVISGSDPKYYTISWQSSYNHSCDYNVSAADWKKNLNVPASGLSYPGWPSVRAEKMGLSSYCREFFHAKKDDGTRVTSIKGAAYDCRMRGWYFSVKRNLQKQWSGVYVDRSTDEVAVALCIPLLNSSAPTGAKDVRPARILPDANGLIGVACTGLYLSDISENLALLFPEFEANAIYVQERSSGYLIAVSTTHREAFYDIATKSRIYALQSPDPLIAWSARMLVKFNNGSWPTSPVTIVRDVNETVHPPRKYQNLSSLVAGRSYYISTQLFTSNGLEWDIVSLQAVNCPHIYERGCTHDRACSARELECVECEHPWTSAGGASRCDMCKTGYYEALSGICKRCQKGSVCEEPGITIQTLPVKKGFYRFADDARGIYKCEHNKKDCTGNGNCSVGSEGPFCASCVDSYYFDIHQARCLDCDSYDTTGMIAIVLMFIVLPLVLIVSCCFTGSKVYMNTLLTNVSTNMSTNENQEAVDLVVTPLVRLQRKLKLLYTYFQIVASFSFNLAIVYPAPFSEFLAYLQVFNLDFLSLLPLECAIRDMDFFSGLVINCLLPLAVSAILLLLHWRELKKEEKDRAKLATETLQRAMDTQGLRQLRSAIATAEEEKVVEASMIEEAKVVASALATEAIRKQKEEEKKKAEKKAGRDKKAIAKEGWEKIRREYIHKYDPKTKSNEARIVRTPLENHENGPDEEHHFDPMQVLELATRVSLHTRHGKRTHAKHLATLLLEERKTAAENNGTGCEFEVKLAHAQATWWFHNSEVDDLCHLVLSEERRIPIDKKTDEDKHMEGLARSMANHAASKRKIVKNREKRNDHYFQGFLLLTYIVLPMVSSQVFMSFRCDRYHVGEELGGVRWYLSIDPSIECAGAKYDSMVIFASVMIVLYPVGIPFLYFILLMKCYEDFFPKEEQAGADMVKHGEGDDDVDDEVAKRNTLGEVVVKAVAKQQGGRPREKSWLRRQSSITKDLLSVTNVVTNELAFGMKLVTSDMAVKLQDDDAKEKEWAQITANHHLSFLLGPYERRCYWYEVIECFRRLSLSGLLVTFGPGSLRQIAVGCFLCLFFIRVSAYFNALRLDEDDVLNEFCSWQLFFILFLTLLLRVDAAPPGVGAVLLGSAIFSFIAVLGLFGYLGLLRIYQSVAKAMNKKKEIKDEKAKLEKEKKDADAEKGVARESGGEVGVPSDAFAATQQSKSMMTQKIHPLDPSEDSSPELGLDTGGGISAAAAAAAAAEEAKAAKAAKALEEAEAVLARAVDDGTIDL